MIDKETRERLRELMNAVPWQEWHTGESGSPFYHGYYAVWGIRDGDNCIILQPNQNFPPEAISTYLVAVNNALPLLLDALDEADAIQDNLGDLLKDAADKYLNNLLEIAHLQAEIERLKLDKKEA